MTNQLFCYWLQGYLEISKAPTLTKGKALLIKDSLHQIREPLGYFTQWLSDVLDYFCTQGYNQALLTFFIPEIALRLNSIFLHVIDPSYQMTITPEEAQHIHNGTA